jgi:hypothetical protein
MITLLAEATSRTIGRRDLIFEGAPFPDAPRTRRSAVATKTPVPTAGSKPPKRRTGTTAILAIMHAALVGVAAVYAATHSIPVVLIAAGAAVLLAAVAAIRG